MFDHGAFFALASNRNELGEDNICGHKVYREQDKCLPAGCFQSAENGRNATVECCPEIMQDWERLHVTEKKRQICVRTDRKIK